MPAADGMVIHTNSERVHKARKGVMEQTKGHYPAPLVVLPLVVRAPRISLNKGLEEEVEGVLPLSTSPIAKNLIDLSPYLATLSAPLSGPDPGAPQEAPPAALPGDAGILYPSRNFR